MLLTERQIRSIIAELILEGYKDDQRYLIEKYPDHAGDLSALPPKWIAWLTARFGENARIKETHPFDDTIVTVMNFSRKETAIPQKYRDSEQFRNAFDERFPGRSPSDPTTMTAGELETILGLLERKKQRTGAASAGDIERDRVGKVGPWNLWMPTTRENSVTIAQYDPVTLEPKTSWCTARTSEENLFYNYIGRPGEDVILFYIIKDNPKENEDWISLGFVDGEPELPSPNGGLSLDRDGGGMTPKRFEAILGPYHDEILNRLKRVVKDVGGTSPARQKFKDAGQDPEALEYLIRGLSRDTAIEMKAMVLSEPSVSSEVLSAHLNDDNQKIQRAIAANPKTPHAYLKRLAISADWYVRLAVAKNPSTPAEILMHLEDDDMNWVRGAARDRLWARGITESILRKFARRIDR